MTGPWGGGRGRLNRQLRLLKMRLAWIKYSVKRDEALEASNRLKDAEQALRTAQAEAAPLVQRDQYAIIRQRVNRGRPRRSQAISSRSAFEIRVNRRDLQARKKTMEERRAALVLEIRNVRRQMDELLGRVNAEVGGVHPRSNHAVKHLAYLQL